MQLHHLQAEFAEAIKSRNKQQQGITNAHNIAIYHTNMMATFTAVLKSTYPLLVKLLGEAYFHGIAKRYLSQYPASSDLDQYGEYFSDFIDTIDTLRDLPYLNEVARFEWLCHTRYYAADPSPVVMRCQYPIFKIIDLCEGTLDGNIDLAEGGVDIVITRHQLEIKLRRGTIPLPPM